MAAAPSERPLYLRANGRAECPDRAPDLTYTTSDGYRCYRWRPEGLEILEHRWVMDAPAGMHVHHIDHDPLNNEPWNLVVLTHDEHREAHASVSLDLILAAHRDGLTTTAIGARFGIHPSNVYRRLANAGCTFARQPWNRTEADEAAVVELHDEGKRAPGIARALGLPLGTVRRVLRSHGRRGKPGRPPRSALEDA